ncbi:MAG: hypothetical protein AAF628_16020 [Planctomycetota bacterium]
MRRQVCEALCLDSAGGDGLAEEISQVVAIDGDNAIQAEIILIARTGEANVVIQTQVSNDGTNWSDQGSPQSMNAIGRKVLTAVGSVAAAFSRLHFSVSGAGKAILDAHVAVSEQ